MRRDARDAELAELYQEFRAYVCAVALRRTGDSDEAEDLTQDVFVAAVSEWDRLRDPSRVRPWLRSITVHLACVRIRRRQLERRWISPEFERPEQVSERSPSDAPSEHATRLASLRVRRALDAMPRALREAWVARALDEETLEDAARRHGCSLATIKRRVALADALVHEAAG